MHTRVHMMPYLRGGLPNKTYLPLPRQTYSILYRRLCYLTESRLAKLTRTLRLTLSEINPCITIWNALGNKGLEGMNQPYFADRMGVTVIWVDRISLTVSSLLRKMD